MSDMLPSERAGLLAWWLAQGEELTTAETAELLEVDRTAAWRLLTKLSRQLPIACVDGKWSKISGTIENHSTP